MLVYLSEGQFLPTANMPTNVVEFDTTSINTLNDIKTWMDEIKRKKAEKKIETDKDKIIKINDEIAEKRRLIELKKNTLIK